MGGLCAACKAGAQIAQLNEDVTELKTQLS